MYTRFYYLDCYCQVQGGLYFTVDFTYYFSKGLLALKKFCVKIGFPLFTGGERLKKSDRYAEFFSFVF